MTVHVFIGVGPANLHRALKIQKIDPNSKLVFIDDRLRPKNRDIDREKARANIFRFETEHVTKKLLAAGIREKDLQPLIHQRQFSIEQGFQSGDDKVFSPDPFTQIQIRDLQLLLMKTIDDMGGRNKPILISKKIGQDDQSLSDEVAGILHAQGINHEEMQDIKIHVATGAVTGEIEKNEIIYPDKTHYQMAGSTADLEAMPVVPIHGTTTFIITDKITPDQLKYNQRSLDLTDWKDPLSEFGWNLIRPPRIRVFYANDVLYIGTEIPIDMNNIKSKKQFEKKITEYTRTIAQLIFPNLDIKGLPVNNFLRARFPTERGESGNVFKNTPNKELPWGDGTIRSNVTVLTHGDSRYLPHYQTGSGFVTAFLHNELYAEIFSRKTFAELVEWAKKEGHLEKNSDKSTLEQIYKDRTGQNSQLAFEAFQQELFMALSREIIEKNKEKVGRYFNALHRQTLDALGKKCDDLIKLYNIHHKTQLRIEQFADIDPNLVALELLRTNNINFLRKLLPLILNKDFSRLSDKEILQVQAMHLPDFDRTLGMTQELLTPIKKTVTNVIHEARTKANFQWQVEKELHILTVLIEHNKIYKRDYKQSNSLFIGNMGSLLAQEPEALATHLKKISESLKENKKLHQRALFSFFTGKHSHTINTFNKDIQNVVEKYKHEPSLFRTEALSIMMKFHHSLKQGNSRRTLEAFMQELNMVASSSINYAV